MAGLHRDRSGLFYVHFYFDGHRFKRSLRTSNEDQARTLKLRVEETIGYIGQGLIEVPDDPTPDHLWQILRSGGRRHVAPRVARTISLEDVCTAYISSQIQGAKEESSLSTEQHHMNHFKRNMGAKSAFGALTLEKLESYVRKRQQEPGSWGRTVQPVTISKELQTFRQVWEFAKSRGYCKGENPINKIKKPRSSQKPPFMTWEEIDRRITRGGLTEGEIQELWSSLFLRESEIGQFLEYVDAVSSETPRIRFFYPALAFCAYTGARRSEILRAQVDDVQDHVLIREKKKTRERRITFRHIPLHPELNKIISEWMKVHPGGQFLFCRHNGKPLTGNAARDAMESVTRGSQWRAVRGYHILRHSFASNLARHGVDQYKIDEMMGHQTDEMRRRYRHLFPEDAAAAVTMLDFGRRRSERHVLPLRR